MRESERVKHEFLPLSFAKYCVNQDAFTTQPALKQDTILTVIRELINPC